MKRPVVSTGFSFIELMIVIAVVGILTVISLMSLQSYREKVKVVDCAVGIKAIESTLMIFYLKDRTYPDGLADVGLASMKDPWGRSYQYLKIAGATGGLGQARKDHFMVPINTDFDVYSMGPDGKSSPPLTVKDSQDDIIRANDGGYIGPASKY